MEKIELGKKIGSGSEKTVYEDKTSPDKVIGVYSKEAESRLEVRGRFYLTKILHLLFPKNIPDIHASYSKPNIEKRERIDPDKYHKAIAKNYELGMRGKFSKKMLDNESEARKNIDNNPGKIAFTDELTKLGIFFDNSAGNFTFDKDGESVYLDSFDPWDIHKDGIELNFDLAKLGAAIEILAPDERKKASRYLKRLEELVRQDLIDKSSSAQEEENENL